MLVFRTQDGELARPWIHLIAIRWANPVAVANVRIIHLGKDLPLGKAVADPMVVMKGQGRALLAELSVPYTPFSKSVWQ